MSENSLNNNSICVLGMHRSGTSAITRVINLLGVYLGRPENIIEALDDNPKGFWEHGGIIDIHDRILGTFSSTWSSIKPLEDGWTERESVNQAKEDLRSILIREFKNTQIWGWKDPRTCLLLPIWNDISNELNINLKFLIIIRNPIDVANSLAKRNNFPVGKSYLLWKLYVLSSLEHTKNKKRIILSYDNFLDDWKEPLKKASEELKIPWPADEDILNKSIEEFLDTNLRHSQSDLNDLIKKTEEGEIPESILDLYGHCLKAAREKDFIHSEEFRTKVSTMYNEYLINIRAIESEIRSEANIELSNKLNQTLEQKDKIIAEKNKLITDITTTLSWRITTPIRWLGKRFQKF